MGESTEIDVKVFHKASLRTDHMEHFLQQDLEAEGAQICKEKVAHADNVVLVATGRNRAELEETGSRAVTG